MCSRIYQVQCYTAVELNKINGDATYHIYGTASTNYRYIPARFGYLLEHSINAKLEYYRNRSWDATAKNERKAATTYTGPSSTNNSPCHRWCVIFCSESNIAELSHRSVPYDVKWDVFFSISAQVSVSSYISESSRPSAIKSES